MIRVTDDQLATIRSILKTWVPNTEVRVFGSRADDTARAHSDLDLIIIGSEKIDRSTLNRLSEAFEDSDLPFRVDVLDWHRISESFRNTIGRDYERIQSARSGETSN